MRRSICYCEPNSALAGEVNTWKFVYTTAQNLPVGTLVRFDLMSNAREIDWEVPTVNLKKTSNVIFGLIGEGKPIQAKEIQFEDRFTPIYEFTLPQEVQAGNDFTIIVGSPKADEKLQLTQGTRAQSHAQRRRPFQLYIDTTGKGRFDEAEVFNLDVKGNTLKEIKIMAPSFAIRNKRFDVAIRFEDAYGNLTSNAPEETLIELTYENIRENLNWKLFVPETGFLTLPNLYFNEVGVYTIKLINTKTKEFFCSAPIKCFEENTKNLFWGQLHGESEKFDSTVNIENCLCHIRDEKGHNFFATSPCDSVEETSNDVWKHISQSVDDYTENDRFVNLLGFQWEGQPGKEGLRQIIYAKDGKPILRSKDAKYNALKKIYKAASPKEMISIPIFSMGKGNDYDFEEFDPEFERIAEIYNAWGCSEMTEKEGNPWPIKGDGKLCAKEAPTGSLLAALKKNKRFGFVAGGLDDRGPFGAYFEANQEQYWPGLTGIVSKDLSRACLFEALYQRSCIATTGERMIVGFTIAGMPMGSEGNTADKPGLLYNRHLACYAAGTADLEKVDVIRNGQVIHTVKPKNEGYHVDFTYDDLEKLENVVIDANDKKPPFVFYYLRVLQKDGHMAWSSPIWVDLVKKVKAP